MEDKMQRVSLEAIKREVKGSGEARRLRAEGYVPAIVYGQREPLTVSIAAQAMRKKFAHISENILINLTVSENDVREVLIKDYQRAVLSNELLHIDFLEIKKDQVLRTHVPVSLSGIANGVREGGVLEHHLHELVVECLPKDLPEQIVVDVTPLNVGAALHISDIALPEGVKAVDDPENIVILISTARLTADAGDGEEASEDDATDNE